MAHFRVGSPLPKAEYTRFGKNTGCNGLRHDRDALDGNTRRVSVAGERRFESCPAHIRKEKEMKTSQVLYRVDLCDSTGKKIKTLYEDVSGAQLKKINKELKTDINNECIYKIYKKHNTKKGIKETLYRTVDLTIKSLLTDVIKNIDFYYCGVDVEYNTEYNCLANGCSEEGICRCCRIYETEVKKIDLGSVINTLSDSIKKALKDFRFNMDEEILYYCLDRYLRRCGLENDSSYYIKVSPGYYGDEIDGVYLESYGEMIEEISRLVKLDNLGAVKRVLEIEYGFLTDFVAKTKKLHVIIVPTSDLKAPNEDYCRKLDRDAIEKYRSADYMKVPVGVFRDGLDYYRIIDGYHRFHAMTANKLKECKILVLE